MDGYFTRARPIHHARLEPNHVASCKADDYYMQPNISSHTIDAHEEYSYHVFASGVL